ncbi:hypothetical protein B0H13DRAFT_1869582 [Mycena leptocephala]|nr:hypothetical protein B0H13DRAFT_1869582 [Mycena leptocephala]
MQPTSEHRPAPAPCPNTNPDAPICGDSERSQKAVAETGDTKPTEKEGPGERFKDLGLGYAGWARFEIGMSLTGVQMSLHLPELVSSTKYEPKGSAPASKRPTHQENLKCYQVQAVIIPPSEPTLNTVDAPMATRQRRRTARKVSYHVPPAPIQPFSSILPTPGFQALHEQIRYRCERARHLHVWSGVGTDSSVESSFDPGLESLDGTGRKRSQCVVDDISRFEVCSLPHGR